ncbi:hypothetical protein, partial [Zemynaea arenosa]|uniref:hypothetical protein n=1 Tax=Zemynaea arenosa TaxID=2561931 RepID=UPI001C701B70
PLHGALAGAGLACAHTQRACDILATTYEASDAHCGFVAVAPPCAPTATRAELLDAARRTWRGWRDTASTWKQSVTACSTQPCDNSVRRPLPNCWLCQAGRVQ